MQETKKWLRRIEGIDREIEILRELQARAFERAVGTVGLQQAERVLSSPGNTSEKSFVNVSAYSIKLDEEIKKREEIRKEILSVTAQLENSEQRCLIRLRYIEGLTWAEVSARLHRSERSVYGYMHRQALAEVKKIRERSAL